MAIAVNWCRGEKQSPKVGFIGSCWQRVGVICSVSQRRSRDGTRSAHQREGVKIKSARACIWPRLSRGVRFFYLLV